MKVNGLEAKEHRKSSLANQPSVCYNIEVIAYITAVMPQRLQPVWGNGFILHHQKESCQYERNHFQRTEKCLDPFL